MTNLTVENADITMYANNVSATTEIRDVSDIESQVIPDLKKINDWLKETKIQFEYS